MISFFCSLYIAASLQKLGKNPLICIYCYANCIFCCNSLSGIIFGNDLTTAPKAFCFFQGYMVQFITLIAMMSAVCFAHESYSLIVKYNRSTAFGNKKLYYVLVVIYPLLLGIPLLYFSLKTDAIIPRQYKCDVTNPVWVRMLGYSGGNLLLSIPGGYFSARSAYALYGHLDQFRSEFSVSDASQNSTLCTSSCKEPEGISLEPIQTPNSTLSPKFPQFPQRPSTQQNLNQRRYNMTKDAAIRMSILSLSFMLAYFLASFNTIIDLLTHKPLETKISINDWVGSVTGIYTFVVLLSRDVRRAWKIFR